ncbi:alpha/beta hydrolase [Rossellomorea vietnamensis]|uniref:Alpha/beta hydrolase n=1 Tax=Rossellomorea vietnamensis TaxID=218284 RepID=A0A5D4MAX6_9BACI|nr:alpha/beta hydrolase [Rossellomorea vietnamensis]TYR98852.1 alpha/beta hydrolase [Rossellomorea vietnamensis]
MENTVHPPISAIIHRTLKTAGLFDGFWERWLAHVIDEKDMDEARLKFNSLTEWIEGWEELGQSKAEEANKLVMEKCYLEAEGALRQAGLYYYLNYWIHPALSEQKINWYQKCLSAMYSADSLSGVQTNYEHISLKDKSICSGRVRVPENPKGCIIIVSPIDSSKEELYLYESEFIKKGFITLSFDGPGQGETFLLNDVIGTKTRWKWFIDEVIHYASETYGKRLPVHLFGTGIGASWVLYGCGNEKVESAAAVSPAVEMERMNIPAYYMERMKCSCLYDEKVEKETEVMLPSFKEIKYITPVLLFHGKKDLMVPVKEVQRLYKGISSEKCLIEYDDEGHLCNNKLDEIQQSALKWFLEDKKVEKRHEG